jgi:muramoyltetrapeptide carboxypeptidase
MDNIYPAKLKSGDEIRVIAPARSLALIGDENREIANKRFEDLGLKVTFSEHAEESDDFISSSIESRVADLHAAFKDPNVKAVLTVIGGFNSNQLLPYIDWQIIKDNPKIFCGFSDITALNNAILAKTGLVNYSGPHYSSFGMKKGFDYTLEHFVAAVMSDDEIDVRPSAEWSDDAWYMDQENRVMMKNEGWNSIQPGSAEGTIIGGNLCTLALLNGTEYMPTADNVILFIEDDEESQKQHFDRNLVSLTQQAWFKSVRGIVIGRFQKVSEVLDQNLEQIIANNPSLKGLPVIANVDFGHTAPILTLPIGGQVRMVAGDNPSIVITRH